MMVLMVRFARITGQPEEAQTFVDEANRIKTAFNEKYLDKKEGRYANNTVTANILPLCFGMVPEEYRDLVFKNIADKTEGEFKSHVSTGLVGIQWLMRGLSDYGRADLAYTIVTNKDYPSWGYMVEKGATTIWELWNGDTADPGMNSGNHVMLLGDLVVWFYEYLAGIKNAPGSFGFEQIEMKPFIIDGLDYVTADFHSVKGLVKSAWKKQNDIFNWQITLPANTGATLYIPAASKEDIQVDKRNITQFEEIKFLRTEGEYQVFEFGSGNYTIEVKAREKN
jgi:alpha-L-rhamnosidase